MSGEGRERFDDLVAAATSALAGDEVLLASVAGEDSDFVRFNGAAVRQAGSVRQRVLELDLIEGQRHATGTISLTDEPAIDRDRVLALVEELREQRAVVPDDPYLLYATDETGSERVTTTPIPDGGEAIDRVLAGAAGRDLVGVYAGGDTFAGFANSLGLRHWFETTSFNLDWSFYLRADKAAKNLYAGSTWDDEAFARRIDWSTRQLDALDRDPIDLTPGGYRTYLAPAAMQEVIDMLAWGGFGLRSHRTRNTPLLRMVTEDARLHPAVRISEDIAGGTSPTFQGQGFGRPDEIVLVDRGAYAGHLISPRSAQEYGVTTNGAEDHESPVSITMAPGDLPTGSVLDELGTGLYVGNLWYLNFSDRAACRTTGMTRFATFWVEGGEIVAPVNVLRFDDTVYHLLGDRLAGLTDSVETILDPSTYGGRSTASARLPGALVEEMTFTL